MSTKSVLPSNHLILFCPLLLLPSILSSSRVFSNESALCNRWPKYWSFSFRISPSNEYAGVISCRIEWLDFPAIQGTLKSLLQHHSLKVSILRSSAFFIVQLSLVAQSVKSLPAIGLPGFDSWIGKICWRRKWQPTPEFLPEEFHGQRSLVGYNPWGQKELDTTVWLTFTFWHPFMSTGKSIALNKQTFVGKVMSLLFNMLSRLVKVFLPRSKHFFDVMAAVTICSDFGAQEIKSLTIYFVSPSIFHEVMGSDAMILVFECWVLSQLFHSLLSFSSRDSLVLLHFLP